MIDDLGLTRRAYRSPFNEGCVHIQSLPSIQALSALLRFILDTLQADHPEKGLLTGEDWTELNNDSVAGQATDWTRERERALDLTAIEQYLQLPDQVKRGLTNPARSFYLRYGRNADTETFHITAFFTSCEAARLHLELERRFGPITALLNSQTHFEKIAANER